MVRGWYAAGVALGMGLFAVHAEKTIDLKPCRPAKMLPAWMVAGNAKTDPKALGGYGSSDNLPQVLPGQPKKPELYLEIVPGPAVPYAETYEGIRVRLVNGTGQQVTLPASDSRLSIIQEAMDTDGTWKPIEYLVSSWCGNSYHSLYLPAGNYWEFIAPRYSGPRKTAIRFVLLDDAGKATTHSLPYEGGIEPGQFIEKADYQSTNIMDPYGT